ncbi:alpha/beta hydrolase-fold protein [Algoriphagus sp. C2-6-M1]|uniref:alpha/beta hydrolase n=1 Tax=Algoriphagus persicinus TaxID=3108754 RepID=UPI002B3BABCA|nr:alpha/beta hydrolase-fold protein [Algoriphagus sp. C2-6-M1]MEB2782815.1 alpha/beta hydrolase-fold protein [Algoriphagus sp. C2-6-M1]
MRQATFLIFTFLVISSDALFAQSGGKVIDNLSVKSNILAMDRKYSIYLPEDYESSGRSYPVLYLLHGAGDDQTGWVQFGEVKHIADMAIQEGFSTAMIIVMPDANTGQRGYFNSPKNDWNYEDFFFDEFMPYIEKTYRIRTEKRYRAIAGLSMGGGGTLMYALHRPDLFSAACPLSAYVGPISLDEALERWNKQYSGVSEKDLEAYYQHHSALELVENVPEDQKNSVRWYIDCGDGDFLYEGNSLLHIAMRKKEMDHEFRIRDGVHSWSYWRSALPEVMKFVTAGFHQF